MQVPFDPKVRFVIPRKQTYASIDNIITMTRFYSSYSKWYTKHSGHLLSPARTSCALIERKQALFLFMPLPRLSRICELVWFCFILERLCTGVIHLFLFSLFLIIGAAFLLVLTWFCGSVNSCINLFGERFIRR
jgi:hypothetical protein